MRPGSQLRTRTTRDTMCGDRCVVPPLDNPATFKHLNRFDHALADSCSTGTVCRAHARCSQSSARNAFFLRSYCEPHCTGNLSPKSRGCGSKVDGALPSSGGEGAAKFPMVSAPTSTTPLLPHGDSIPRTCRLLSTYTRGPPTRWCRNHGAGYWLDRIPGASLTLLPAEGHFVALTRRREVLLWLAGIREPDEG